MKDQKLVKERKTREVKQVREKLSDGQKALLNEALMSHERNLQADVDSLTVSHPRIAAQLQTDLDSVTQLRETLFDALYVAYATTIEDNTLVAGA